MTVPTSHRATQDNGPSVIGGRLIWTSATGITTADPHSFGGCTLKWQYEHVFGMQGPPTAAMLGGTALHGEVEDHLTTGASLTSPLALAGRMFIPHPGNGLLIEKPIHFIAADGVHMSMTGYLWITRGLAGRIRNYADAARSVAGTPATGGGEAAK